MSDAPDGEEDVAEPAVEPYVPFPSFEIWAKTTYNSSIFKRFEAQLVAARNTSDSGTFDRIIEQATRSAAVDTGALEGIFETDRGFTYSVAAGAALVEIRKLKGERAARAIEDALNAYEYVLNAATHSDTVTEAWIRELHAIICASQATYTVVTSIGPQEQALPKGEYKKNENSPVHLATNVIHSYASVLDTPPEMARFVEELRSDEFEAAHPVVQAAYAHYAFVCVHPFADGNGRVSRALASVYLYRRPGIPLVIYADQKNVYLDSLESADEGDYGKFLDFINFRVIDTLATVRQDLRVAAAPSMAKQLEELAILQTGREGLTHAELDNLASYLLESQRAAFADEVTAQMITPPLSTSVQLAQGDPGRPVLADYRKVVQTPQFVSVSISSTPPAAANTQRIYTALVAKPGIEGPDFLIVVESEVVLEAFVRDLSPALSESLVHRQKLVASTELSSMLAEVVSQATNSLRKTGYGA